MTREDELRAAGVPIEPGITQSQVWLDALKLLGYRFRLNMCDDSIEINEHGTKLSDIIAARIRTQMRDRGIKQLAAVEDAYAAEAERNAYHPIKDYFNGLAGQWDGKDRLRELVSCLQSDTGIVEYRDGSRLPVHAVYLRRWMLGVVAKALDGVQNTMLTMDGPQGIGKSLLARWLCPVEGWFIEGPINPQDKDCDIRLMTRLIWEVSELDATTRKADVSALKAFITKAIVTVRKAYGRYDITKPAICSMVGTINGTAAGFLSDETGNRRFLIMRLTRIDWRYTAIDREQLWAQIVHMYREEGETPALLPEEQAFQGETNRAYEMDTPVEDWVRRCFTLTDQPDDALTMGEIISHLDLAGHRLHGSERAQAMEVARALVLMGAKKEHTRGGKRWVGIVKNHAATGGV